MARVPSCSTECCIAEHPHYQELVSPLPGTLRPVDAELYIRDDFLIVNADGYAHPTDIVVGQAIYAPRLGGDRRIFGVPYRKVNWVPGTTEPLPYGEIADVLRCIDPTLDQRETNPWPLRYEQLFPRDRLVGWVCGERAYRAALSGKLGSTQRLELDLAAASQVVGRDVTALPLALTGAPALGIIDNYHDLDLVIRGSVSQNRAIADAIRNAVIAEPDLRVHENGKSWLIRFHARDENRERRLICCFFRYDNPADAPLHDAVDAAVVVPDVTITGVVANADHALYTPTIVELADARAVGGSEVPAGLTLVVHHTASRGELNVGDAVWARGALVDLETTTLSTPVLWVVEREGVRNETPPWPKYYSRARYR